MPVKVYVGGPSSELPRVLAWIQRLEAETNIVITHRWWDVIEANGGPGTDGGLPIKVHREAANADLTGIDDADLVWFLWPTNVSHGTAVEFGYALSKTEKTLIVTGARAKFCVFTALTMRFKYDDAGFWFVKEFADAKD